MTKTIISANITIHAKIEIDIKNIYGIILNKYVLELDNDNKIVWPPTLVEVALHDSDFHNNDSVNPFTSFLMYIDSIFDCCINQRNQLQETTNKFNSLYDSSKINSDCYHVWKLNTIDELILQFSKSIKTTILNQFHLK